MRSTPTARAGFTLVEVVIALGILSGIVLLMAPAAQRYVSVATRSRREIQAAAIADAELAQIRVYPTYDSLRVRFDSTKNDVPFPGWMRTTSVVRTGANTTADITRITVTVTGPGLAQPIKRILTVAAP